ncbi:hypothetical protein KP509_03G070000 [Ceratopteris richardii]|uniref:Single-stranded DNA binding protein Ssb-like OB fold domain-containing protein n=1 Tax=Ceratopteris richardii TaxID=49495 RepID=A0A8T2V3W2_CERRI|nr:hypothetical protein KP509_03G070000 [Ceratopteris richardii]
MASASTEERAALSAADIATPAPPQTPSVTLRKPTFTTVDRLRPGTSGHTLTVKVVNSKLVLQKARPDGVQLRQVRISECLVGDDTGTIVFTARNDQGWNTSFMFSWKFGLLEWSAQIASFVL